MNNVDGDILKIFSYEKGPSYKTTLSTVYSLRILSSNVKYFVNALNVILTTELARLNSLGLGYNNSRDRDAKTLASSFPNTLTKFGLVDCTIGDQGGKAMLKWGKYATEL